MTFLRAVMEETIHCNYGDHARCLEGVDEPREAAAGLIRLLNWAVDPRGYGVNDVGTGIRVATSLSAEGQTTDPRAA